MIPLDEAIEATLRRLGLAEPLVMMSIARDWDVVAGDPWAGKSTPLYLREGVLVVEVSDRSAMGFLRYAVAELERRLASEFGPEAVKGVEIRPAGRQPGRRS